MRVRYNWQRAQGHHVHLGFEPIFDKCVICGRPLRYDMESVFLWGTIEETGVGKVWVNNFLGVRVRAERPTPHMRRMCLYHRDLAESIMCPTATHYVLKEKEGRVVWFIKDLRYWAIVLLRFLQLSMYDVFGMPDVYYLAELRKVER